MHSLSSSSLFDFLYLSIKDEDGLTPLEFYKKFNDKNEIDRNILEYDYPEFGITPIIIIIMIKMKN